jgi:hypothetical protein
MVGRSSGAEASACLFGVSHRAFVDTEIVCYLPVGLIRVVFDRIHRPLERRHNRRPAIARRIDSAFLALDESYDPM